MKLTPVDIKSMLFKNSGDYYDSYGVADGWCLKESAFDRVATEIIASVLEIEKENAELSAKVKAYEAIIENSNFKMAVRAGSKKTKKGDEE